MYVCYMSSNVRRWHFTARLAIRVQMKRKAGRKNMKKKYSPVVYLCTGQSYCNKEDQTAK
jgi:hypothetical protein